MIGMRKQDFSIHIRPAGETQVKKKISADSKIATTICTIQSFTKFEAVISDRRSTYGNFFKI